MTRPIHLAIVTPLPPHRSSIGQYGYYLSNALAYTGKFARITLLAQIAPNSQWVDNQLPFQVERVWRRNRLDAGLKILTRLRQLQPDLVWYNLGASIFGRSPLSNVAGLLSPALSRIADLPSVVTLHELIEQADLQSLCVPYGRLSLWGANLIQRMSVQADVVCVTLRRHGEYLSQRNFGVQVMHIPHGIFNAPELLADSSNPELLFIGYVAPFKGLELLLGVFRDLHTRCSSLRLSIAGEEHPRFPGYLEHIRRMFDEHVAIHWLGYVPEVELRSLFARSTMIVLPSIATTGSSSALYRAAGWGRPIVASDLPELRAVAEEEQLWVEFFPSKSKAGLTAALEHLLNNPARRAAHAYHNYCAVMNHLTLKHTCQAYLYAFELALFNHRF